MPSSTFRQPCRCFDTSFSPGPCCRALFRPCHDGLGRCSYASYSRDRGLKPFYPQSNLLRRTFCPATYMTMHIKKCFQEELSSAAFNNLAIVYQEMGAHPEVCRSAR